MMFPILRPPEPVLDNLHDRFVKRATSKKFQLLPSRHSAKRWQLALMAGTPVGHALNDATSRAF
uniref:hypothetical protein n=1 Tax=Yoonia sp. TaxID=2212373 RepID=UPI004048E01B